MSLVPNPLICSVEVIAKKAISANLSSLNSLKQIPPMTFWLFLRIIIDSWFRSKTNFTIYYFGIFGSCLAKMFFKSNKNLSDSWLPSFLITLNEISCFYYCVLAALSRAANPRPTFWNKRYSYLSMHTHEVITDFFISLDLHWGGLKVS
jgi:hypothetical protein